MIVLYEVQDNVAKITLNRPELMNALTVEMRELLGNYFEQAARDSHVRCVLLQANGPSFCASGDVNKMGEFTPASSQELLKLAHRVIRNLANIEKPVVASVRGAVAGIGWSMAMACDMIVASDTAYFSQVLKRRSCAGWWCHLFLTQYLGVLKAKELVMSGKRVSAQEALALQLVNQVVTDEQLDEVAWAKAVELAKGPTFAFGVAKKMFKSMNQPSLETFLDNEAWSQGLALLTEDHKEGFKAFLEKENPFSRDAKYNFIALLLNGIHSCLFTPCTPPALPMPFNKSRSIWLRLCAWPF